MTFSNLFGNVNSGGDNLNTRITKIRKESNMTQEQFALEMGISKNYVNLIENGKKKPGDRLVSDICRKFNINEEWLRKGKEPMKILPTGKLSSYIEEITHGNDDFIKDIIEAYMELDRTSKDALKELVSKMIEKNIAKRITEQADTQPSEQATTEELEAAYKKSRSGTAQNTSLSVSNTTADTDGNDKKKNASGQ